MLAAPPRRFLMVAVVGVSLASLAQGCSHAPSAAEEEAHAAPVKAVAARRLALGQWTELLGATQPLPDHVARICCPFDGRVSSMLKDAQGKPLAEGQRVNAGDVLAQLDIRIIEANRDEAQAALRDLQEQKKQADLASQLADLELKRLEELERQSAGQLVRPIELKKARLILQDAESKQRGVLAKEEAGKAHVKALNEQLELSKLRTPISGRLGLMQVTTGQTLASGATVCEVADLDPIDVLCFAPPRTAALLVLDQPARISRGNGDANESAFPSGKVVFIAQQAHPETGNFAVKVRFPNREQRLRANSVLSVQVLTQPEQERLTIPEAALMEDRDPPEVVVIQELKTEKTKDGKEEKRGKARRLRAVLGVRDRDWQVVEILRLEDPEKKEEVAMHDVVFIIEGGHGLQDGDAVKLEEDED